MKPYNKDWFNEYANYGFDMTNQGKIKKFELPDSPLHPLDVNYVIKSLQSTNLGVKKTKLNDFFGQLEWGNADGALQVQFSPLGGLRATIRKLVSDLQGQPTWICKKVIEVKHFFDKYPDSLTFLLEDVLKECDQQEVEAPVKDWNGLQKLTLGLASELRRKTTQVIFMYQGIRMIEENKKYIIHFGCTGYGRQKAQRRLDQLDINVEYHKTGLIKIAVNELGDSLAQYRWIYDPSTFLENFSPVQKEAEIIAAMLVCFNSY